MLNLTGRKPRLLLGVDIASSAVKLVELRRHGGGVRLQGYVIRPLPPAAVVERRIADCEAVSDCLGKALAQLKPATRHAAVAVPASAVITRCIDMDATLSDEEMEGQVLLEAEQFIPYPLAEVAIDFQRKPQIEGAGEAPDRPKSARVSVQLTACRKDNVESRVRVLQAAGLEPRVVDVESCAIARACELLVLGEAESESVAVVDIGATRMTLHVLRDGEAIYTREQLSGGRQSADGIARQVDRSLQLFYSSHAPAGADHRPCVKTIVLAGGAAATPGLLPLISERTGFPALIASSCLHLPCAASVDGQPLQEQMPALMTALGLAMRTR